jgi:hypothetical protein
MEFAIVVFPTIRGVNVDDAPMGQTCDILRLQRGTHIFDLGFPENYSPESQRITLTGTSFERPRAVLFTQVSRARGAARPASVRTRKGRKAASRRRATTRRRSAAKKTSSPRRRKTSTAGRRKAPVRRRKVNR